MRSLARSFELSLRLDVWRCFRHAAVVWRIGVGLCVRRLGRRLLSLAGCTDANLDGLLARLRDDGQIGTAGSSTRKSPANAIQPSPSHPAVVTTEPKSAGLPQPTRATCASWST